MRITHCRYLHPPVRVEGFEEVSPFRAIDRASKETLSDVPWNQHPAVRYLAQLEFWGSGCLWQLLCRRACLVSRHELVHGAAAMFPRLVKKSEHMSLQHVAEMLKSNPDKRKRSHDCN